MDNVKQQLHALAKAHEDGIDIVSGGIQNLYQIVDHLTQQLRNADILIATLKHLLIRKGVITEQELSKLQATMVELANSKLKEQNETTKGVPTAVGMETELKIIHDAAKKAAESPYDSDAFIFGS